MIQRLVCKNCGTVMEDFVDDDSRLQGTLQNGDTGGFEFFGRDTVCMKCGLKTFYIDTFEKKSKKKEVSMTNRLQVVPGWFCSNGHPLVYQEVVEAQDKEAELWMLKTPCDCGSTLFCFKPGVMKSVGIHSEQESGEPRVHPSVGAYVRRSEAIDHPSHYGGDTTYEAIKVIEAWGLGFCLGNAVKYICRFGKKDDRRAPIEDLKKASWYLQREIQNLENEPLNK
jgi:hypothetical protein